MATPMRTVREARKETTRAVAQALGINQSHYCRVENGKQPPSPGLANRIARHFGNAITRDQILFPEDYIQAGGRKSTTTRQLQKAS